MRKKRVLLSALLTLVFMFAIGVVGASATDVTWNPNDKESGIVLSNNNLTATSPYSPGFNRMVRASKPVDSGKWYWEVKIDQIESFYYLGVCTPTSPYQESGGNYVIRNYGTDPVHNASYKLGSSLVSYGTPYKANDIVSVILNMDDGTIEFWLNGQTQGVAFTDLKTLGQLYPKFSSCQGSCTANFGATPFAYPIPAGYQPYNGQAIQVPTNLAATAGDTKADLSWNTVDGATSYNIKRASVSGGTYETVGSSVYAQYTNTGLTNGTDYYYVVTAVTVNGESVNSNEVKVTPQAGVTPPTPTGNGTLVVTVANNVDREYNLTMAQIQAFIDWYGNRSSGGNIYTIEKPASGAYTKIKDYLVYDKIVAWEVREF